MKSSSKNILSISFTLLIGFNLVMFFSFLFPGQYQHIDKFRLSVQSSILGVMWCYDNGENHKMYVDDILLSKIENLKSASIIFTSNKNCLGELFVRGEWTHVAIYLGAKRQIEKEFGAKSKIYKILEPYYLKGDELLIIDSSGDGVSIRNVNKLFRSHLKAVSVYKLNVEGYKRRDFVLSSLTYLGKEYDYDLLTFDKSSMYCSELVYYSLQKIGLSISVEDMFINRKYILPISIINFLVDKHEATNVLFFEVDKSYKNKG